MKNIKEILKNILCAGKEPMDKLNKKTILIIVPILILIIAAIAAGITIAVNERSGAPETEQTFTEGPFLGTEWTAEKFTTVSLFEKSRDYKKIPFVIKKYPNGIFLWNKENANFSKNVIARN